MDMIKENLRLAVLKKLRDTGLIDADKEDTLEIRNVKIDDAPDIPWDTGVDHTPLEMETMIENLKERKEAKEEYERILEAEKVDEIEISLEGNVDASARAPTSQMKWADEPEQIKNGLVTKVALVPVSGEMRLRIVEPHEFEKTGGWRKWDRRICKHCNRKRDEHDSVNWVEARYG